MSRRGRLGAMIAGAGILPGTSLLLAAFCVLALSALAPTSASAKTGELPASKAPRTTAEFRLQASNGYVLDVSAQPGNVTLQASTGSSRQRNFSLSSYSVKGPRSPSPIDASFGALGEISVSFQPSGKVEVVRMPKAPKGCHSPRKIVRRLGTFTGAIRFEGEGGYTSVDATSAEGSLGPPAWFGCFLPVKPHAGDRPPKRHRPAKAAYLGATNAKNTIGFSAFAARSKPEASFSAQSTTKSGAVSILRFLLARAPKSSFIFDNSLSSAIISPPLPFTGSAEFRRGASPLSGSWAGSLAVSFPGAEDVPLTGSGFTALLQRQ